MSRSIINEAAAASPKQPIVNMGQGFFGYNPPDFILNAAKQALDRVECNQYSPTKGRPRLRKAIADAYSPHWAASWTRRLRSPLPLAQTRIRFTSQKGSGHDVRTPG
ncbi:aminotransferase class I and II [Colletotrichum higginsianum]|nr:aminotransferase class I and II [Colletotrichum higginsianum]